MASISDLYSLQKSSSGGIEGYHVEKKYYDPVKMKEERILSTSTDRNMVKPTNISKKTTFIDDVQKHAAKIPGPTAYESTVQQRKRGGGSDIVKHPDRKTFIDQLTNNEKKNKVPGVGSYSKVESEVDKTRLRPNLSRAHSPTYAEACMRNSLDNPGVGNYNAYRAVLDHKGSKWGKEGEIQVKKKYSVKLPSVGTYTPNPVSYNLFSSISNINSRKVSSGMGGKSERWKTSKEKKLPFYDVLSQWGMKDKNNKKDIMSKVSTNPHTSRSVYY